MDYQGTLDWMFAQLPMYQRQGASAYKIDLTNTVKLASYLDNPESRFKSIHVAGTNGKGSTSHMLASILQESGYKVGLYTSPHLKDFRERIRINGEMISEAYVVNFIRSHKQYFEVNQLSFFEMTVGLAFRYFADSQVDVVLVEVGLGGRLDSTNIITPAISVITNIGLDHTQFLGNTLPEIASEKAGIIKKNVPVVIGRTTVETKKVFRDKALSLQSDIFFASDYVGNVFDTDLKGDYQKENVKTVLQTISVLQDRGWDIREQDVRNGLSKVVNNTGLLGRWQILQDSPKVICDTAHNEDGLQLVMEQLSSESYDKLHIVLGVVNDKDLKGILPLFPIHATYYFAKPEIVRGLDEEILKKEALKFNLKGESYTSVKSAYKTALQLASEDDLVYVGGSTFVVAEII
ncbi:bifunctional folylpolyglutamate synthase/dihydrofolate synthase [Aquimarina sp. BL5]|uniref:bifunctional folylpolyglutamate synthase/dihydrofolate synthase n=1 Tax=Aquimarina sp. BL5 TaxID=1714860 RepID=UPI000E504D80|nr:folylpolyglutamate synthase/dihydrofolate synthase family protein [Aquimarina sp. BL5]AXT52800.1 bifunctional folylpolyglutamate synthase/dihydrofolate synthase [Aquimarina sp. BL5]RKN07736.1 bifunctional folylpolyglutamate synthase/dihydrofolate synthase [Aquimarina sp. BL5]